MGHVVSLELHRALQGVEGMVVVRKLPTKREYCALRRAFMQGCIQWSLAGVKVVDG